MKVKIPSPLHSYTNLKSVVTANGNTIFEILDDLDKKYPGIRFRIIDEQDQIRKHMIIFLNQEQIDSLNVPVFDHDTIHIIAALSGG